MIFHHFCCVVIMIMLVLFKNFSIFFNHHVDTQEDTPLAKKYLIVRH